MPSVTTRVLDEMRIEGWIETNNSKVAASAKKRVVEILMRRDVQAPAPHDTSKGINTNFWMSASDDSRITSFANLTGMSQGEVIANLLFEEFEKWKKQRDAKPAIAAVACTNPVAQLLEKALAAKGRKVRAEQAMLTNTLHQFIGKPAFDHEVLMAEAGTGVGKTVAYLAGVHEFLGRTVSTLAMVAVPSFALMNQVLREWRNLQEGLGSDLKSTALMGQGEFVSSTALTYFLDECTNTTGRYPNVPTEDLEAMQTWLSEQGPCASDALIPHLWTVGGLRHACPNLTQNQIKEITLAKRLTDDDAGYLAYRMQWSDIPYSRVVFCTHAMLANLTKRRLIEQARDMKGDEELAETIKEWKSRAKDRANMSSEEKEEAFRAWKASSPEEREPKLYELTNALFAERDLQAGTQILPNIDLLVVDEGHALEDAFAAAFSSDISLKSVLGDIKSLHSNHPDVFSTRPLSMLEDLVKLASERRNASPDEVVNIDPRHEGILSNLTDIIRLALTPLPKCGKHKAQSARESGVYKGLANIARTFEVAVESSKSASSGAAGLAALMHWSPIKAFPRIHVGRLNCSRELHYLWSNVASASIVISGTVYESIPISSCETTRRSLAIPFNKLVTMQPIHAQWQIDPVTMCMITTSHRPDSTIRFCRPKARHDSANSAAYVQAQKTWHEDISRYILDAHKSAKGGMLVLATSFADVKLQVAGLESLPDTVLAQSPEVSLASLRLRFLDLTAKGQRPVLIAVGSAWTGFDIYDEKMPDALTDLVIMNAPFGVIKRTLSRMLKMNQKSGNFEISYQVLVLVRQAIGRLIRSPDTPHNRRIHWLDARIHHSSMSGILSSVKRFLGKYKQLNVG